MSDNSHFTYRDGQLYQLTAPYREFKQFKKNFNEIVGDGFSSVFQAMAPETTIISKMRFEFEEAVGFNVVDTDVIGRLAYVHQDVVAAVTGTITPTDLTCFVMTHAQVESNGVYVEEVYFQFPYIKSSIQHMSDRLLHNLRHFFETTGIHEQMELIPTNSIEEILSGDVYKNNYWPLPGSYLYGSLLTLSHVFDKISAEQVREGRIVGYPPEAYFNSFQLPDGSEYDLSNSFYFTDLNGFEMIKKKKTQREKNRDVTSRLIEERQKEVKRTPAELCRIFVNMLAPERYASESSRTKLGQVLFNVIKGAEEGLELWKDSIQQKLEALNNSFPDLDELAMQLGVSVEQVMAVRENSEEQHPPIRMPAAELDNAIDTIHAACDEAWDYFEYTQKTIGTLKFWAKMDNPEQYQAFLKKDIITLAWRCLNPNASHTDVARLVYAKYSDQVCCANIKDNVWFGYWQHRWHELDKCHHLRIKISDEMPALFEKVLDECHAEYVKAVSDEDKEKWSRLQNLCNKMIKDLKTVGYKNNIITECAERFYDPKFLEKLDEDRSLLGLPNGVYELETGIFRPGKPEDFITLTTKAKYNSNYHWDHPRVKDVVYYFKTVYPDRKLRHYVQKIFGTILEGGNMNKDFYNMIGEGDNSKSMIAKALKLALGKYISKIPVAMIMGKRGGADNATPHLADKKGIRALFVEEPPKGQSNASVVKELTGNDDILSRALFKMPIIFSPQWKLFVFTNHLLDQTAEEKAYWNRQKVVDHESTFSFDAPLDEKEQFATKTFPRDPLFDRKLIAMAEPLLWCLIQWYGFFKEEGLVAPDRVLHATNVAKLKNDIYLKYMNSCLDQGTQHDFIEVHKMYDDFRTWHQGSFRDKKMPDLDDFTEQMSKKGHMNAKPIDDKRWAGVKFRQEVTQLPIGNNNPLMAQAPSIPAY